MKLFTLVISALLLSIPLVGCAAAEAEDENTVESTPIETSDPTMSTADGLLAGCTNAEIRTMLSSCHRYCPLYYGSGVGSRGIDYCSWFRSDAQPQGMCESTCVCTNGQHPLAYEVCRR